MIKNKLFLLTFIYFIGITIYSQEKRVYFDANWIETGKDKSVYYRPVPLKKVAISMVTDKYVEGIDSVYVVKDYYVKNNQLQFDGFSLTTQVNQNDLLGNCTWYDSNGTIIKKSMYRYKPVKKEPFYSDVCMSFNFFGVRNAKGEIIIPPKYHSLSSFKDNLAIACNGIGYGVINVQDEIVLPFEFESISFITKDFFIIAKKNKYGVINRQKKELIPSIYDNLEIISDSLGNFWYLEATIYPRPSMKNMDKDLSDKEMQRLYKQWEKNMKKSLYTTDYYSKNLEKQEKLTYTGEEAGTEVISSKLEFFRSKKLISPEGYFKESLQVSREYLEQKYGKLTHSVEDEFEYKTNQIKNDLKTRFKIAYTDPSYQMNKDGSVTISKIEFDNSLNLNADIKGVIDESGKILVPQEYTTIDLYKQLVYARDDKDVLFFKTNYNAIELPNKKGWYYIYFFICKQKNDFFETSLYTLTGIPIVKPGKYYLIRPGYNFIDVNIIKERNNIESNNTSGAIDYLGIEVFTPIYSNSPIFFNKTATVHQYSLKKTGIFEYSEGLVDFYGKWLVPLNKYNTLEKKNNYYITKLNNKYGIIDHNGEEILPPIYYEMKLYGDFLICSLGSLLELEENNIQIFDLRNKTFSKPFTATEINDYTGSGYFIFSE